MNELDRNKIRRRKVNESNSSRTTVSKSTKQNSNISRNSNISKNSNVNKSSNNQRRRKNKSRANRRKIIKTLLSSIMICLFLIAIPMSMIIYKSLESAPILTKEDIRASYISSEVVDSKDIPQDIKDAIVSIEDERFYEHGGVDVISLIRSLIHNIMNDTTQGGSTLEMQLSKNILTESSQTMKRKITDIYNAFQMNKIMTKDEILAAYLNNIYLGKSAYGVSKGAEVHFGKKLSELNLAECAMLVGITNNPAKYQEFSEAKRRQEVILTKMKQLGYITEDECSLAIDENISFRSEIE